MSVANSKGFNLREAISLSTKLKEHIAMVQSRGEAEQWAQDNTCEFSFHFPIVEKLGWEPSGVTGEGSVSLALETWQPYITKGEINTNLGHDKNQSEFEVLFSTYFLINKSLELNTYS